jgi:hypothetical protein
VLGATKFMSIADLIPIRFHLALETPLIASCDSRFANSVVLPAKAFRMGSELSWRSRAGNGCLIPVHPASNPLHSHEQLTSRHIAFFDWIWRRIFCSAARLCVERTKHLECLACISTSTVILLQPRMTAVIFSRHPLVEDSLGRNN